MNILFASIEDLNDWIEPLGGHPQVKTPNLARLAARGMLFTNAMSPAPACSPARTATLFGQAPWQSGVYTNDEKWQMAFPAGARQSLIGCLRDAGYTTSGAGKVYHLDVKGLDPADFDDYNMHVSHVRYPVRSQSVRAGEVNRNNDFGPVPDDPDSFDAANTDWMCRKIVPGVDRQVWSFGLYRPHLPFIVPQAFFDLYPETVAPPPGLKRPVFDPTRKAEIRGLPRESNRFANRQIGEVLHKFNEYNAFVRAYLASISYADAHLGRVLDRLDETGQTDNTLVVLWSDHGWQLGEKLAFRKFTLWERALRVPLIFAGPGVQQGTSKVPVSLLDLYPTLLNWAGARAKLEPAGVDLAPILRGSGGIGRDHVISAWGKWGQGAPHLAFSLRSEAHRYTIYWNGGEELYDSENDPFEHENLMVKAGGNVRALANRYQAALNADIAHIATRVA
jgi:arylsulfatase A-like enzyme